MGTLHCCPACPVVVWLVAWCQDLSMLKQFSFSLVVVLLEPLIPLGNQGVLQIIKVYGFVIAASDVLMLWLL